MANEQNLRPIRKGQLSKEELKKRQSNGGKKSAQVRRERKMLRQVAEEKLTEIMSNGKSLQENLVQKLIVGALASGAKVKETLDVFSNRGGGVALYALRAYSGMVGFGVKPCVLGS